MSTFASTVTYESWDKSSTKLEWHGILPKNMGRWNREEMIDLEGVTQDMIDSLDAVNWEDPNMADQFVHDEEVRMDATETNRGSRAALAYKKDRSDGTISCLHVKVDVQFRLSTPHHLAERDTSPSPSSTICHDVMAFFTCGQSAIRLDKFKLSCCMVLVALLLVAVVVVVIFQSLKSESASTPFSKEMVGYIMCGVMSWVLLTAVIYNFFGPFSCRSRRRNNYKNMEEGEADTGQKNVNQDVMGLIEEVFQENGFQT